MYIATIDIVSSVVWACSGRVIVVGILSLLVSLGKALSSDLGIEDLVSVLVMFILMFEPFLSLGVGCWRVVIHAIVWADSCWVQIINVLLSFFVVVMLEGIDVEENVGVETSIV